MTTTTTGLGLSAGQPPKGGSADTHDLEQLVRDLADINEVFKAASGRKEELEKEIAHRFPETAGTIEEDFGGLVLKVRRSERWTWSQPKLAKAVGEGPLPEFAKRTISVDKRKFEAASADEREPFYAALTVKLIKPTIEVVRGEVADV